MSNVPNITQNNTNAKNNLDGTNFLVPNNLMINFQTFIPNIQTLQPIQMPNYPQNYPPLNYPNTTNTSNQNLNSNTQNHIILVPAHSPITQINQNNSTHPSLLGSALIPIINEKPISASQKYQQIIKEVLTDNSSSQKDNLDIEILKKLKKCDLHPKALSDKCRKCKEIKKEISKIKEEIDNHQKKNELLLVTRNDIFNNASNPIKGPEKEHDFASTTLTNQDNTFLKNTDSCNNFYNTQIQDKTFKFIGDPITCNMNTLLLNNILSCQYFKENVSGMDFMQLIEEIIKNVTYAEPWTVGTNGIPSTLFCILYKFMLMKLTDNQVYYLINYHENDYVRCAGFLYIRYMSDPKDLWGLFYHYLTEEKHSKSKISFGEFCENLLNDYDYYGTRLSRIPIQIEREIKGNLYNLQQARLRKAENEKNIHLFTNNKLCSAVSFQDNKWHKGRIVQNLNYKKIAIYFPEGSEELDSTIELTENKWYNFDIFKMRYKELKEKYANEKKQLPFFSCEEIVDLQYIILEQESSIEKKKESKKDAKNKHKKRSRSSSRSRSRSNKNKRRSSSSRKKSHKYSRGSSSSESSRHHRSNRQRRRNSRSSSSDKSSYKKGKHDEKPKKQSTNNDENKKLKEKEKEIIKEEKRNALAIGRDYAAKPTSYKSSLSLRMPLGNTRKRSKSPSPIKQNIQFIDKRRSPSPIKEDKKIEYSEEFKQRQELLKRQYGDSNKIDKSLEYQHKRNKDEVGPEIYKLG